MQHRLYILTSNNVYEGDFGNYEALFLHKENAEKAYEEWVQQSLEDCIVDGTPPIDITNEDDDFIAECDGEYVYTKAESEYGKLTSIYVEGEYANNHIDIRLTTTEIKDYNQKEIRDRAPGLRKKEVVL